MKITRFAPDVLIAFAMLGALPVHSADNESVISSAHNAVARYLNALSAQNKEEVRALIHPEFIRRNFDSKGAGEYIDGLVGGLGKSEFRYESGTPLPGKLMRGKNGYMYAAPVRQQAMTPTGRLDTINYVIAASVDAKVWHIVENACALQGYVDDQFGDVGFDVEAFRKSRPES